MEISRAYGVRLLASVIGICAIAIGAPRPWIQHNPAHEGFMTAVLYPIATSGHVLGTLLFWGAIVVAGLLVVEMAARATGPINHSPISRRSMRVLGVVALTATVFAIVRFPPILVVRARVVTTAVYLVAIGGALLIGGSFTHRLLG